MNKNTSRNTINSLIIILVVALGIIFYYLYKTPTPSVNNGHALGPMRDRRTGLNLFVGSAVGTITNGILGKYLTDTKGMTLYTFAGDGILKSNCVGDCLKKWPPFVYDNVDFKSALDFPSQRMNVMKRSDGTFQYAYGVQPVYYYYGDVQLGDTNGKGLDGGKWNLVLVQ